jgi:hypothetical protein
MITTVPKSFLETTKSLLSSPRALAIFAALYALLLATLYFFISTREATVWQVVITIGGLVVIPAEFFVLQAAIIDHTKQQKFQWRGILIDAIKLFVVTIPILLLGWLLWYLLNKWQLHYPAPKPPLVPLRGPAPPPQPTHWPTLLFATLRCLLFGVALPLATIHLWIKVAGTEVRPLFAGDVLPFLKRIGNAFARAFASDSVFIYALGLIVFFLIPYASLFIPIKIAGNKTEFLFFILRLLLVFAFTLIGWVVTLQTLATSAPRAPEVRQSVASGVSPEPAVQNP